ncbi:MAG: prenyltransferase [Actinobacteria bacterium]|nr:MAG: prenyltransferase [Actinomycetota bacterium]
MTLVSATAAGLLAVRQPGFSFAWYALAVVGLLLAHAGNNLMNDLFDLEAGSDTWEYPRALYAPHPVLSGMISRRGLAAAAALVNLADAAILVVLRAARGWPVVAFALAGLFVSAAYTAPPLRLKKRGLGEPSVLLVWGPLMVGGTYYAATGRVSWSVIAASIPYALAPARTRTLPVVIGERPARVLTKGMMAGFYVSIVALVASGILPWPAVVGLLGVTRLVRVWNAFGRPKPDGPPPELPNYPVWPLWFAAGAFVHARRAGALFVLGLAIAAIFNIT